MPEIDRPRVNLLGVGVHPVSLGQTLEAIASWIDARERRYVCLTAIHSILACQKDPELRRVFNRSGLTTTDGMALVWLCRIMRVEPWRIVAHPCSNAERAMGHDVGLR
jgi:N-acetylglucosaminyldiphosphoundecaprenol N-acetyl-beta-D-mannosaminyltransferase